MLTAWTQLAAARIRPPPDQNVWQWAQENVDFSLVDDYETPLRGRYDPDFIPQWKEPVEAMTDTTVREVWVLKPARAGGTENLLLNPIRYHVAVAPAPILYLTGDQKSAEHAMEKRIKDGLRCTVETRRKLNAARALEHDIWFSDCSISVKWPKNKTAFKQQGASVLLADEVSIWPATATAMLRKRADTYRHSHLMGISSPDPANKRPSEEDPIFVEYASGDQRKWHWLDPQTGHPFVPTLDGLKWDPSAKCEDGSWDLRRVRESAHYVAPSGAIIQNQQRLEVARAGRWIATNPDASDGVRSYHLNCFSLPFKNGDFGQVACAFLEAKRTGKHTLRVFIYEYMAETWVDEADRIQDGELLARERHYERGESPSQSECHINVSGLMDAPTGNKDQDGQPLKDFWVGRQILRFLTVDVQKAHLWYVVREWVDPGDSGLIDFGYAVPWEQIEQIANTYSVERVAVDYGYTERRAEVFQYAHDFRAWPLMGRDRLGMPFLQKAFNPLEGKRGGSDADKIKAFEFDADTWGTVLLDMLRGESPKRWFTFRRAPEQYVKQVTSMERVNGVWQTRRGRRDNHLWDCEVMQVVLAAIHGLYRMEWKPQE